MLASLLVIVPVSTTQAAITDKCDGTSTQNSVTVTATHGKVFYIDSGQNQNVDASYVGYKIAVSSSKTNVWARLDTFTGGVVSLANPNDANLQIGDIASGYKTAYFLLKAPNSTSSAQSHVVRVFTGKPNTTGATEIYSCTYSFLKVSETIKAAANKLNSITTTSSYVLGSNLTIVVNGDCGTVGQGTSTDGDIMWVSPASRSSWPTSALRLTNVSLKVDDVSNLGSPFLTSTDELKVTALRTKIGGNPYKCYYEATYTFKIVGSTTSAVSISPIAQISSGTQIKHTDMSNQPSSSATTNSITVAATLTKSVSATTSQTSGKTNLSYTLTLANTNASNAITFDEIIDTPASGLIYVANSVRLAGATTAEPVTDSAGRLIFSQPISVNANSSINLTYTLQESSACSNGTSISYVNSAVGKIGTLTIGSNSTSYSVTTAAGTCGTVTLTTASTTATTLPVEVVTFPATSITNTTATLNGTIDPNGNSGQTISFVYGTSSSLSGATTINLATATTTSTTPYGVSTNLTGLSSGTIYYFRVKVGSVQGDILNFVTTEPVGTPTAVTTNISGMTAPSGGKVDVTLNGSVDPNQVSGGAGAKFEYALDSDQTAHNCSGRGTVTTASVYELDDTGTPTNVLLNLTGAFSTDVSVDVTNLTANRYYCYRVMATWSTSSTYAGTWVSFYSGTISTQTITFNQISTQSTSATYTLTATASSNLTVSYTSNTTSVCTIDGTTVTFLMGGTCSITANQSGNYSYYPADPVTVNFLVTAPTRTITFNNNDGSGTMATQSASTPTAINLNTFTRVGYTFNGWSTSSGVQSVVYSDNQEYSFTSDITLYAQWTANTYSITYNAGTGGSGADYVQTFTFGTNPTFVTNSTTGFTQSGKVVTGWNEVIGGTGTSRAFGDTYSSAANLTVYAQWGNAYTVTFNANGGTGSASVSSVTQATVGGSVSLATVGSLAKDYSGFMGWGVPASGGTFSAAGSSYTPSSSLTLYAQWITTGVSSNVTRTDADLAGTASLELTNPKFCYSSTNPGSSFDASTCSSSAGSGTYSAYSTSLTSLSAGTTYYYQLTGTLGGATSYYGTVRTFTTLASYSITINSATGGSGASSASTVASGGSVTLTATPSAGYAFSSWSCSGGGSLNSSTANPATLSNITANATCTPVFVATYSITINSATGGSATTSAATVNSGGSVTLTASASTGYIFSSWSCSGGGSLNSSTANPATLSNITANATCTPVFTATYTVTIGTLTNASGSTISVATSPAIAGATITLTVNPSAGLQLKSGTLIATPTSGSNPSISGSGPYTFTMPASNVVVTAEFESIPAGSFSVTIATATGGTGSTSSAVVVSGGSVTLSATPSSGYKFVSWSCDGGSLSSTSISGPTLSNITSNVTCTPTFALLTLYTVTFNANGGSGSASVSSVTQVAENGSVTLATVGTLTLSNSGFIGWGTSNSGGTFSNAGATYTPASSLTLYAMWITTSAATSVASTTASLNGSATLNLTDPKFCYSTSAPGSNFDPTTCSPVTASGSYTAAVTGLTASTTYYFQIFGTVSGTIYYGAVLNFTTSAAASTYSITVNAGTGGTASSSAATVTSGGNVTLTATPSSGYSFSSWTCSGGGTLNSTTANPATLSGIAANATCTANFTRNSGGGGVGPQNNPNAGGNSQNVKIVVQKSSTPGGNNPNRPTTPGTTAPVVSPQPVTTTVTTTVVNQDGSKVTTTTTGVTNSSASAAGQTNSSGGSINALTNLEEAPGQAKNEAKVEAKDTTAETKMVIDANVPPSVVVNRGQDNKVQVQAVNGWTGRVSVAVVNESDDTDVKSYLEVVINPLPVTNVEIQLPERGKKPEIKFDPSPSQVIKYEIQLNGKTVCEGTETACALPRLIGPKSKVDIIARGQDDTAVVTRLPAFTPPAPIPALTVYFPLASSQLTRSEIKKLDKFVKEVKAAGFTRVVLEGHTDVQGARSGYNNLALSNSRAQATANYLRKFLKVRFAKDQFAETRPAVEGSGEAVYQNNRRTEVYVW